MSITVKVAFAAAITLCVAAASLAKDNGPPRINIENTCRQNTSQVNSLLGAGIQSDYDSCVSEEKMALDELTKNWASYPAVAKSRCVQPGEYLPGYIEWKTCIEMTRDVTEMRKEESKSSGGQPSSSAPKRQTSRRRTPSESEPCPIVKLKQDGSLDWIDACSLDQSVR
jgi:hypothetical protein